MVSVPSSSFCFCDGHTPFFFLCTYELLSLLNILTFVDIFLLAYRGNWYWHYFVPQLTVGFVRGPGVTTRLVVRIVVPAGPFSRVGVAAGSVKKSQSNCRICHRGWSSHRDHHEGWSRQKVCCRSWRNCRVVARGREIARFIAGVRATGGLITGAGATKRLSWHRTCPSTLQWFVPL